MKRIFSVCAALLVFAAAAVAQPRAIGVRAGWGAEVSYQHTLGAQNFLEVDLGWSFGNSLSVAAAYDFDIAPVGPFNFYAGPAAHAVIGGGFGLGVGAQVGLEYDFNFPLQLSLDWRPTFYFVPATAFGWQGFAIGIRYRF